MSQSATMTVSPEEARKEVGRILLAQEKLAFFAEYMSMDADNEPWYQAHKLHHLSLALAIVLDRHFMRAGERPSTG